jgi:hypothetical protein
VDRSVQRRDRRNSNCHPPGALIAGRAADRREEQDHSDKVHQQEPFDRNG